MFSSIRLPYQKAHGVISGQSSLLLFEGIPGQIQADYGKISLYNGSFLWEVIKLW